MKHAVPALAVCAGLLIGLGALLSCGGPQTVSDEARRKAAKVEDAKREITALWTQIRQWRKEGRMSRLEPTSAQKISMRYKTSRQAAGVCPDDPRPKTPKCQDVCSLGNAICENAGRICRIADELKGDPWAREKCNSAKASCREAKQRCCKCVGRLGE